MNVTCPQCSTVFRVDPAKVPERGIRARCSVCAGLIAVRRPADAAPAEPSPPAVPAVAPPPVQAAPPPPPPPPPPPAPVAPPVATVPPPPPPKPEVTVEVPVVPSSPPVREAPPPPPPAVPISAMPEPSPTPAPDPISTSESAPKTSSAAPTKFTNPFLQQDPSTRARRLARALVSDLVVYHPEKRQRGLADGNLKELFGEEIRKSWEEYTEQVGDELARTTPYFTEALNEILAEGRTLFG